jgi:hypothetical protein
MAETDCQLCTTFVESQTLRGLDSLGQSLPVRAVIKLEVIFTSKFDVEVLSGCKFRQVWVESDLVTSNWVHGTSNRSKEGIDPPSKGQSRLPRVRAGR